MERTDNPKDRLLKLFLFIWRIDFYICVREETYNLGIHRILNTITKANPENIFFRLPLQPRPPSASCRNASTSTLGSHRTCSKWKLFMGSLEMQPLLDHMPTQEYITCKPTWKPFFLLLFRNKVVFLLHIYLRKNGERGTRWWYRGKQALTSSELDSREWPYGTSNKVAEDIWFSL